MPDKNQSSPQTILFIIIGIIAVVLCIVVSLALFVLARYWPQSYNTSQSETTNSYDDITGNEIPENTIEPDEQVVGLNLTYDEVMNGIEDRFDMKEGEEYIPDQPLIGGEPYSGSVNLDSFGIVVIGEKENITAVELTTYLSETGLTMKQEDKDTLDQVFKNVMGDSAKEASDWIGKINEIISEENPDAEIEFGDKIIWVSYYGEEENYMLDITIIPAD